MSSTAGSLVRLDANSVAEVGGWGAEEVALLKEQVAPGASDAELVLLARYCRATGLDPFRGQIYGIVRRDSRAARGERMTIQVGIGGLRTLAARTGFYDGVASEEWCGDDGAWRDVWLSEQPPAAARVGVYRKGAREPIYGVALWRSYAQRNRDGSLSGLWGRMPAEMLSKCAEAKALRRGFPDETAGLYTSDEVAEDDAVVSVDSRDSAGRASEPPAQAPEVRVVVEPDLAPTSVEDELAGAARDQVKSLSTEERAALRRVCADLGVQPTARGLVQLAGEDVRDLRRFIAKHAAAAPTAPPPKPVESERPASPPPPAPGAPGGGAQGEVSEPAPVARAVLPIDYAAAAISALNADERIELTSLAEWLGWIPKAARLPVEVVVENLGRDARNVGALRGAIANLRGIREAGTPQPEEIVDAEVEDLPGDAPSGPHRDPAAGDFADWLHRGHPEPTPEGPQEERLL